MKARFIFIATLLLFLLNTAHSQVIDEPYDFPIKPGTPEWRTLETHADKLNVLQIPDNILKRLSTRALLETCLNYPMFRDIVAFNTLKEGMEILIANYFNGFPELLKREDAYTYLSEKFIIFDPFAINEEWSLAEKGNYTFELIKIELLLRQDNILETASYENKVFLLKEVLLKHEKMLMKAEYYPFYALEQLFFLTGKIFLNSGNPDVSSLVINSKDIYSFLETGRLTNYNVIDELLSTVIKIIN